MERLLSAPGIPGAVPRPGCLDSKPNPVDAAEEVEESSEIPTGPDHRWLQPSASPADLGQDEQMAIGEQERGPLRLEPSMVQRTGAIFPA